MFYIICSGLAIVLLCMGYFSEIKGIATGKNSTNFWMRLNWALASCTWFASQLIGGANIVGLLPTVFLVLAMITVAILSAVKNFTRPSRFDLFCLITVIIGIVITTRISALAGVILVIAINIVGSLPGLKAMWKLQTHENLFSFSLSMIRWTLVFLAQDPKNPLTTISQIYQIGMNGWLAAFAIRERVLRKKRQHTEYNAKDYALNSSPQLQRGKRLIAKVEQKENLRVLDVGCGNGRTTLELCRHLPNIEKLVGVDFSASQIDAARKLFLQNPYIDNSRVRFVQGSFLEQTPKQLGHFDLVFSNLAIHWIGEEAYALIHELLAPTGKLIAEQCAKDDLAGLANARLTAISELGLGHLFDGRAGLGHLHAPTKDELQAKLERVGFANIAIEQEEIGYTVSDGIYEAYAVSSLHSFYDALGDAKLCTEFKKKFLEICCRDRVPAVAKRLIIIAEKPAILPLK